MNALALLVLVAQVEPQRVLPEPHMDGAGWTFLLLSWIAVLGVTVYCFARVLRGKQRA